VEQPSKLGDSRVSLGEGTARLVSYATAAIPANSSDAGWRGWLERAGIVHGCGVPAGAAASTDDGGWYVTAGCDASLSAAQPRHNQLAAGAWLGCGGNGASRVFVGPTRHFPGKNLAACHQLRLSLGGVGAAAQCTRCEVTGAKRVSCN